MKVSPLTGLPTQAVRSSPLERLRPYWSGRGGLLALGGLALVAGVGLNWGWLTAAGVTPILLAVLPCAAMCALGLCMPGMMKKHSGTSETTQDTSAPTTIAAPLPHRLQLASANTLPDRPAIASRPETENVGVEQSCCHPAESKESPNAKNYQ